MVGNRDSTVRSRRIMLSRLSSPADQYSASPSCHHSGMSTVRWRG